jgi:hypothetical protein
MIFPKMLIVRSQGLEMVQGLSALFGPAAQRQDREANLASPAGLANEHLLKRE